MRPLKSGFPERVYGRFGMPRTSFGMELGEARNCYLPWGQVACPEFRQRFDKQLFGRLGSVL